MKVAVSARPLSFARCGAAGLALLSLALGGCGNRAPRQQPQGLQRDYEVQFRLMQAAWNQIFSIEGSGEYRIPRIAFYKGELETPCGKAAGGLEYCQKNRQVSVDLDWLERLRRQQPDAPLYLLARITARHVQQELTIDERIEKAIGSRPASRDDLLRKRDLQTDCLVGVWRHHDRREPSAEALKLAARWLAEQGGEAQPSVPLDERLRWFDRGVERGEIAACNIFAEAR